MGKVDRAKEYGYIVEGWYLEDYLRDAIKNNGWESLVIWGPKGSLKSNLLLQAGYLVYGDWQTVLNHIIFTPQDFIKITEKKGRIPWLGWDDIGVHLPRSLYFTNRQLWSDLKSNWDAFRVKLSVFMCTAPRKDKVASFITDDLSGEIFLGKRVGPTLVNLYDFQRWIWSLDLEQAEKPKFDMVRVEKEPLPGTPKISYGIQHKQNLDRVLPGCPTDVFKTYFTRRVDLAEQARSKLANHIRKLSEEKEEVLPKELAEMTNKERRSWAGKVLRGIIK